MDQKEPHPMRDQAFDNRIGLELEAIGWTDLRAEWQRNVESFNPLLGLMLIGMATVNGDAEFVEEHLEAVRAGFAGSAIVQDLLGRFHKELLALMQRVDEETRVAVIDPWIVAVEKVSP